MCMKKRKQQLYRPKGLSKAEDEWLKAQTRRAVISTIVILLAGLATLIFIFNMALEAARV